MANKTHNSGYFIYHYDESAEVWVAQMGPGSWGEPYRITLGIHLCRERSCCGEKPVDQDHYLKFAWQMEMLTPSGQDIILNKSGYIYKTLADACEHGEWWWESRMDVDTWISLCNTHELNRVATALERVSATQTMNPKEVEFEKAEEFRRQMMNELRMGGGVQE